MALAEERQRKELEYRTKMDEVQRKKMEIKREEERAKEELKALEENFRIKQELVQKEAQMIASIKHEEEDHHILLDEFSTRPPTEIDSRSLLEKFLHDQSASVSEANVPHPNQARGGSRVVQVISRNHSNVSKATFVTPQVLYCKSRNQLSLFYCLL